MEYFTHLDGCFIYSSTNIEIVTPSSSHTPILPYSLLLSALLSLFTNTPLPGYGSTVKSFNGFRSLALSNKSSYTFPSHRPKLLSNCQSGKRHASTSRTACGRISSSNFKTAFVRASCICRTVTAAELKNSDAAVSSVWRAWRRKSLVSKSIVSGSSSDCILCECRAV